MGKRQVISIFVALSAVWLGGRDRCRGVCGELPGDVVFTAVGAGRAGLIAWRAQFTPNSRAVRHASSAAAGDLAGAAITFDDGPSAEYTPRMLDALARGRRAEPPSSCLGRNVHAHPEIARRIVARATSSPATARPLADDVPRPDEIARQLRSDRGRVETRPAPRGAAVSRPARLSQPVPGAGRPRARLPGGGMDAGVWDTAKPGIDVIVSRSCAKPAAGRDPAAARRRRLRQRRRPLPDGGGAAADPRRRPASRARVRDRVRARRRAAPAPAAWRSQAVAIAAGGGGRACRCSPPSST